MERDVDATRIRISLFYSFIHVSMNATYACQGEKIYVNKRIVNYVLWTVQLCKDIYFVTKVVYAKFFPLIWNLGLYLSNDSLVKFVLISRDHNKLPVPAVKKKVTFAFSFIIAQHNYLRKYWQSTFWNIQMPFEDYLTNMVK